MNVAAPLRLRQRAPLKFDTTYSSRGDLVDLDLPDNSPLVGRQIIELGLPKGALLVLIGRGEDFFVPSGSTRLAAGDHIYLLANQEALSQVKQMMVGSE